MSNAHHGYRGYAGQVAGGVLKPGDEVKGAPLGPHTRIASIDTFDGPVSETFTGISVIIRLDDDLDVSRSDMICRPANEPSTSQSKRWCAGCPTNLCARTAATASSRPPAGAEPSSTASGTVSTSTLCTATKNAIGLDLNEIGRVRLRVTAPPHARQHRRNRTMGSFLLADEATNATVGAGMILGTGD